MECLVATDPKKALQVIVNYSKKVRSSGGGAAQELKHTLQVVVSIRKYSFAFGMG